MAKITRTWWGESFLEVLDVSMDEGRLKRGRAYAGPNRLLTFSINKQLIKATLRGNINHYFGVYKEPRYKVDVKLKTFSVTKWDHIINEITHNTACLSQLLMNEMPASIEDVFHQQNLHLLPEISSDLISNCSCPDYASPCKHVAGVYYKVASLLDRDPFLLFQLRGMNPDKLQQKLAQSPLGKALIDRREEGQQDIEQQRYRYTHPQEKTLDTLDLKTFWQGKDTLPKVPIITQKPATPAVLIKKGGDYPAFWQRDNSFIEAMEIIYPRIIEKNKVSL
ncbi:MAG: SWIM zinc finger family protein [Cocleimonas sp.]|nr:SWIM zinc finger family protein [Cocleimonas sp.]